MSSPLVSVIVPAYNSGAFLGHAVGSALDQTVDDIEVIVVDDGSTPPVSPDLIARNDVRLRIVTHPSNRGAAAARNTGIANARGTWLAFLDADDVWHPQKLQRQLEFAALWADASIAIATGWRFVTGNRTGTDYLPVEADTLQRFASGSWFCPGSTVIMPRDCAMQIGPQDDRLPRLEDYDWFLRFAKIGGRLKVVPESLVDIRWHRGFDDAGVRNAAAILSQKYLERGGPDYIDDALARTRIRSYLALNEASAAWYESRPIRALAALLRSLAWCPRRQIQIERLWTETPALSPAPANLWPPRRP
jgi:glycosyltransferase involved in cell wall biosynthesis